jgi:hypothetical protein
VLLVCGEKVFDFDLRANGRDNFAGQSTKAYGMSDS